MRWLTARREDDRGAVAVWVALSIIPIVGFLAVVADVGMLYWERGQLQNGADSAALSVAMECAQKPTTCSAGSAALASTIASQNANDGNANATIADLEIDGRSGSVTVVASTLTDDGAVELVHPLASMVVGAEVAQTVDARATVEWGTPVAGNTLALAFGLCEFMEHMPSGGSVDGTPITVRYDTTERRNCGGVFARGGFGWLDSGSCQADISLDDPWVEGDPGASSSGSGCPSTYLRNLAVNKTTVLVPLFEDCRTGSSGSATGKCTGANTEYQIVRFAAFKVTGIKIPGTMLPDPAAVPSCGGGCFGIQGYFLDYVELGEDYELGDAPYGGLQIVRMID